MSNKLVLCEGKTDAILLSYYLEKTCGWTHKRAPKNLEIKADERNGESAYWYVKGDDNLLICGVGGKDNFASFFKKKIEPVMINSTAFSKIAVVTDRDDRQEHSIQQSFQTIFQPIIDRAENDVWLVNTYRNAYGQEIPIEFLLLIVPPEKEGALETMLLDAIAEKEYDGVIVERSRAFVDGIEPVAKRYIEKTRLKLKACLGVTWAIQYPEKIFHFIDEQIRSVPWKKSDVLAQCFHSLKQI